MLENTFLLPKSPIKPQGDTLFDVIKEGLIERGADLKNQGQG